MDEPHARIKRKLEHPFRVHGCKDCMQFACPKLGGERVQRFHTLGNNNCIMR